MAIVNFCNFSFVLFVAVLCLFQIQRVNSMECGRVNVIQPLVRGGNSTLRNEWPFIVALYEARPTKYICGGTLISNRHVLTAAHCIHRRHSSVKLSSEDAEVRLGAYNLTAVNEIGAERRNVAEIFVHDNWKPNDDKYDADLAILVLSDSVTFSDYIQPICVPANDVVIEGAIIDVRGTVVGWGLADNEIHEELPRKIVARALNNSLCYRTDPGIISSSSNRSFCAKCEDGTPNKGDSGGGFFVVSEATWVQYGIVSALRTNATGQAAENSFSIYTNVKSFKHWIVDIVTQSGGEVGESTMKVTLACSYQFLHVYGFTCQFNELEIRNEHNEIAYNASSQSYENQHEYVQSIYFNNGTMFTLPDGLGNIYKNVKFLQVGNVDSSLGLKHIWPSSLKNLDNLLTFVVCDNDIEMLDEKCLWELPNLMIFRLTNNDLQAIHEKSFDKNEKLGVVALSGNKLEILPKNLFKHNTLLEVINLDRNAIKTLDEEIFETTPNVIEIDLSYNQLKVLPKKLFKNNSLLQAVDLRSNSLRAIDKQIFEANAYLKKVNLNSNELIDLPKNLLTKCSLLKQASLADNLLATIDEQIFEENIAIVEIDLSSNKLEYLPINLFKNNLFLERLNLSNNHLKAINERVFETNVELLQVDLTSNELKYLPRHLLKNNLEASHIFFRNNLLKEIDEQIFETNEKLEFIDLSSNLLKSLPRSLLKNKLLLEVVDLQGNSLKNIHEELFQTNTALRIVFLNSNKLESLPKKLFKKNLQLEAVDLCENSLTTIDEGIFETNLKLWGVNLSSNQLEALPKNLFKNNFLLKIVEIARNSIKTIDEQIFETNTNLRSVLLFSNQLEYLPRNLFKNNLLLQVVDFTNNNLNDVHIDFTELQNINVIGLYRNTCTNSAYQIDIYSDSLLSRFNNLTEFQSMLRENCRRYLLTYTLR